MPNHEGVPETGETEELKRQMEEELRQLILSRDPSGIENVRKTLTFVAEKLQADPQLFSDLLDRSLQEADHERALRELMTGLAPVIQFMHKHADVMEARAIAMVPVNTDPVVEKQMREAGMRQSRGGVRLSEIMLYNFEPQDGVVAIHIMPGKTLPFSELIKGLRGGMKKLAAVAKDDERMKVVEGVSWIVAKNPRLLERAGFTLEGLIEQPEGATEPIGRATMTREKLLELYGEGV
jgi:hypothetical protein